MRDTGQSPPGSLASPDRKDPVSFTESLRIRFPACAQRTVGPKILVDFDDKPPVAIQVPDVLRVCTIRALPRIWLLDMPV